jgi:hypothetical protein
MGKISRLLGLRWRAPGWRVLLGGCLLFAASPAFSQSCALCYTHAASSGPRMISALKAGILILVVPPTLGSIAMLFVVHRKSHQVRREVPGNDWSQDAKSTDWRQDV